MTQLFAVHPVDPQLRLVRQAVDSLRSGGVIAYPTDTTYALGCGIEQKEAAERIRNIRELPADHHFTLVCSGIGQAAQYARIDDARFRTLKQAGGGEYVFILPATKEVPKRLQHPRRRTIGLRITAHPVALAMLDALQEPVLSSTLHLPGDDYPLNDGEQIRDRLRARIELVLDVGPCGLEPSTVVDLTEQVPVILRKGKGAIGRFGLVAAF